MEIVAQSPVLSVSQLNRQVKQFLEFEIGVIQVEGEISNLSKPSSGHFYFTLKDSQAQIRCVYFKNRHRQPLSRELQDGQQIIATGRLSLYEARGDYQLIVEDVAKAGLGALYQQYEALKKKLADEGLFRPELKKAIPKIPKTIGIITSPSGAALQDMLSTLARRYPLAPVIVYPAEVQGANAPTQLIKALIQANRDARCDVLILARGGGSLEDLWAFNNEQLARQIVQSDIPIISGVGHETDVTIADFVADYRAETPTAAAAMATPDCMDLLYILQSYQAKLIHLMKQSLTKSHIRLNHLRETLTSPERAIASYWQKLDFQEQQMRLLMQHLLGRKRHQLAIDINALAAQNPYNKLQHMKHTINQLSLMLSRAMQFTVEHKRHKFHHLMATLQAVSPLATLNRGYAIATKDTHVLYKSSEVVPGDLIEVRLASGRLFCEVNALSET